MLNESVPLSSIRQFSAYFYDRLNRVYHDFFVVSDDESKLGYVYSFDYRIYDLNGRMFVSADRCHLDILISAAQKLFEEYPLKKIFCWVRQDDTEMRKAAERISAKLEAVLREYIYADGKYLDVFVYGISREDVVDER
ncbi:MAG: GNAT family N-acetyltransferase [Clostridia bacterium]|nr:GNAT family N-acetyltransferase [Clostridia bacterium]